MKRKKSETAQDMAQMAQEVSEMKKPRTSEADTVVKPDADTVGIVVGGVRSSSEFVSGTWHGDDVVSQMESPTFLQPVSVSVIIPGWAVNNVTREGLLFVLFDSLNNHRLQKLLNFLEEGQEKHPPKDFRQAFVRIKGASFVEYLQSNLNGLLGRAHGLKEGDAAEIVLEGTIYTIDNSNGGIIRSAINQLLYQDRASENKCDVCQEAGDFILSCCRSVFCSGCLMDEYRRKHPMAPDGTGCRGKGALGLLQESRETVMAKSDKGLICTSQFAITVEAEAASRHIQRFDVFIFWKMESLDSLWRHCSNEPAGCDARRYTHVHHMDRTGNLRSVYRFWRDLPFLH